MQLSLALLFLTLFAINRNPVFSYNILGIFPIASPSHHFVGSALMKGLAADGHEVTYISPFKEDKPAPNYNEVYLDGVYEMFLKEEGGSNFLQFNNKFYWEYLPSLWELGIVSTNLTLNHPRFQAFLRSGAKFDVVIVEIFLTEALLALGHHFAAPVIGVSTFGASKWTTNLVGTPDFPSYVPHPFGDLSHSMTFTQRARNLFRYWFDDIAEPIFYMPRQQALLEKYFPGKNVPSVEELRRNVSLVLLNSHVSLGWPRPFAPNMIEVGGMHIEHDVKSLPKNLQKFLNDAKHGAIFFSLGSNVRFSKMPVKYKNAILNSFQDYPKMRLLLKLDENATVASHKPSDVLIQSWLPQQSVLAHPNVKLFVTHGGLLSTMESIYFGKPVVGIPIFGDQNLNMIKASLKGYGEALPFERFSETEFREILRKVLSTPSYAARAKITSDRYKDQLATPIQTAVHWVKHVAKNRGAPHLRSAAVDLPFVVYYNLDVYAALVAVALFALIAVKKTLQVVFSLAKDKPAQYAKVN